MNKKVGILTTFYNLDPGYSLVTVVMQQLSMLHKYGYDPVLFGLTNFTKEAEEQLPDWVELRKVIPQWLLEPYGETGAPVPPDFEQNVDKTVEVYEKEFADLDVLIAHDICFINSYLIYNVALKKAKLNGLPIFQQIHSGPSARQNLPYPWRELWGLPIGAKLIYMNHSEKVAAAEMFGIWDKDVKVVFNPMDLRAMFKLSPLTCNLIDEYTLFDADIIAVYPLSSTRMGDDGKAVRKVIAIMGFLKQLGQNVRLVIPNAHANGQNEKNAIQTMLQIGQRSGLTDREIVFTSLFDVPNNENGVPHQVVTELFQIANLFIFPSYSENAPLILLEAAATKNLMVLNEDFAPMKDFVGPEGAYYFRFKSRLINDTQYRQTDGEEGYFKDVAAVILDNLKNNKAMQGFTTIRKRFNIDWIAKNQFIPAIQEAILAREDLPANQIMYGKDQQ